MDVLFAVHSHPNLRSKPEASSHIHFNSEARVAASRLRWNYGIGLMNEGGVDGTAAVLTVVAGALTDLCIGLAIAFRRTSRLGLYAAIGISFAYAIIGTILVPRLWADPLGPMLKIWPIIVAHFVALAILEDR